MSVIYKALRTIEAAEGAPGINERAGRRESRGVGRMKVWTSVGILAGVCVVVVVNVLNHPLLSPSDSDERAAASPDPSQPRETAHESKWSSGLNAETAAPAMASATGIGFSHVGKNVSASPTNRLRFQPVSFGPEHAPEAVTDAIADHAFETASAGPGGSASSAKAATAATSPAPAIPPAEARAPAAGLRPIVGLSTDRSEASITNAAAVEPLGRTVDDRPSSSTPSTLPTPASSRQMFESGATPESRTRRVRLLNANLSRAIKQHELDEVGRIVDEMESILGADSVYMMKIRAFTQLSTGGDSEHAMRILREVLVREPGDKEAALNMAVAEINLGETSEARQRLELLAAAHPDEPAIRTLLRSLQ